MIKPGGKEKKTEKGQGLVELGVGFMILLFVLGGLIDLGRMYFAFIAVRDAAQEGAVYAAMATTKTEADIRDRVRSSSQLPIDLTEIPDSAITITASDQYGEKDLQYACSGDIIMVSVTYQHEFIMPLVSAITDGQPLPLQAKIYYTTLLPLCP